MKYYVVWEGRDTGIFTRWADCKRAIDGYPKAKYKSFLTEETARRAFIEGYEAYWGKQIDETVEVHFNAPNQPLYPSIAVDGACQGNPGPMEYRGVDPKTRREIFRLPVMPEGTNNIAEFLAIVHALALLKQHKSTIPVYSDSAYAIKWVKDKVCKTNLTKNKRNAPLFDLIDRALKWLNENTYANPILKWETRLWGENPADFGRKGK
jgi:caulimovirus viroplasmin